MELRLKNGDYVPDGMGGLQRVDGQEELLQRVLFCLTARRGAFPFGEELGSRLWQLGQLPLSQRQAAATQYVTEALAGERDLSVEYVELLPRENGAAELRAVLEHGGEKLRVTLEMQV